MRKEHQWRIKRRYYDLLLTGAKSLEVRVGYGFVRTVEVDDLIYFPDYSQRRFTVLRVTKYKDFLEMLRHENANKILPGRTPNEVLEALYELYPLDKECALGVYVLELEAPRNLIVLSKQLGSRYFNKRADELYDLTDWICDSYPYHFSHYYHKYLPGLQDGTREIIGYYFGHDPAGVIILKNTPEEKKICTLFVKANYRGKGVASALLKHGMEFLGTTTPLITIAAPKIPQFQHIIDKYGWQHTDTLPVGYYNDVSEEWVFNSKS